MDEQNQEFSGATTESVAPTSLPPHAQTETQIVSRDLTAAQMAEHGSVPNDHANQTGRRDESIPVTSGNSHLLTGNPEPEKPEEPRPGQKTLAGPGTENPSGGITRTAGTPEAAAPPIQQVGDKVILPEDTKDATAPEFEPGKPPPRTDVDAEPTAPSSPGFQGLDRVNPLPAPQPLNAVEHRGAVNEPRVVGVQSVGEPPIQVVGSESAEAKAATGDATESPRSVDRRYPAERRGADGLVDNRLEKTERRVAERRVKVG